MEVFTSETMPQEGVRNNTRRKALILCLSAAFGLSSATTASGASITIYPERPVKLYVYAAPGGSSDLTARLVADRLSQKWGQPVVVENKLGANGMVATNALLASKPDGYTLMLGSVGQMALNPIRYGKKMNPVSAFTLVAQLTTTFMVMIAAPDKEFNDLREYLAYAKAHPGELSYSSSGVGSLNHIAGAAVEAGAGAKMVHIPYKGESQAVVDLMSGRVSTGFVVAATAIPLIKSGKVKALAIPEQKRSPFLPDVPTTVEQGAKVDAAVWNGIIGPPDMPKDIVNVLNQDINEILRDPTTLSRLSEMGMTPAPHTQKEFVDMVSHEVEKWNSYVTSANITLE